MDDATALYNGPGFLERHFRSVVKSLRDEGLIHLETIEVGTADSNGERQKSAVEPEEVAAVFANLVRQFVNNYSAGSNPSTSSVS